MSEEGADRVGAVVLTGGRSVRLQGADKTSIEIAGTTLLEHVLGALTDVPDVVVVGAEVPTSRPVTFRREDPAGSGPAAGLLAGLGGFPRLPEVVVALAADMPMVTRNTVERLLAAGADHDGALLVDPGGRRQYLCAAYRTAALLAAAPPLEEQPGLSVHRLVGRLLLAEVAALEWESRDVDTWADLTELRRHLGD